MTAQRKIIHVDMDCFYAAIEIRDHPALANKPVAVGGTQRRSVLCTCNYLARRYGVRSAMPTAYAYRRCPDLIVLPVDMPKYRQVAKRIQQIFFEFTDQVEPLALDEAYLDVTHSAHHQGSATLIAQAIRRRILASEELTASAGVAPNKLLAKIASGWKKPDGLFVIRPDEIAAFIKTLPVAELYGVGKVTAEKLHRRGFNLCADLQNVPLMELNSMFGDKSGRRLYEQCRGIDNRPVEPDRIRKSLSVERTFLEDIADINHCGDIVGQLYEKLLEQIRVSAPGRIIKNQCIKIKFNDFTTLTAEKMTHEPLLTHYHALFQAAYTRRKKPIRLLGMGVHFALNKDNKGSKDSKATH